MDRVKKLVRILMTEEFIIFLLVGCINSLSSTLFSIIYSERLGELSAFIGGYMTGVLISYTLNSLITFKHKLEISRFIKFIASTIPNFLIQFIVVFIIVNILGWSHILAYIIAAVIGMPVTFAIMRIFVFIKR